MINDIGLCIAVEITHMHLDELMMLGATHHLNFTCSTDGNSAQFNLGSLANNNYMFCSDNSTDSKSLGEAIGGCQMYTVAVSVSIAE